MKTARCALMCLTIAATSMADAASLNTVYLQKKLIYAQHTLSVTFSARAAMHNSEASVKVIDLTDPGNPQVILDDVLHGAHGFADPTGVGDRLHAGTPQIWAYRLIGASCEGTLDIFALDPSMTLHKISDAWRSSCQDDLRLEDLDHD